MKEAELDKEYSDKFNKLMSPQKLFKAQQAEKTFMQERVAQVQRIERQWKNKNRATT